MDTRALLTEALDRSGSTTTAFAEAGGTSRSALAAYLAGRSSPTVRTLNRLLSGAGLQVRASLEPLKADVDARVEALLTGIPQVDLRELTSVARSCATDLGAGAVRWAFDGATALNLQGLAADTRGTGLVVVLDDAARTWLTKGLMQCTAPATDIGGWHTWSLETIQASTAAPVMGRYGVLALRVVEALPATIRIRPQGATEDFPVVTLDEVERTQPHLAEVLARYRRLRGTERPA